MTNHEFDFEIIFELIELGLKKEIQTHKIRMARGDQEASAKSRYKISQGEGILKLFRMTGKQLVTIKKASEITGSSVSFFKQMLRNGTLTRYKIHSATYISISEFEMTAQSNVN